MPRTPIPTEGAVTPAEALRFAAIAEEVMASPLYRMGRHTSPEDAPHIGTLREKRLHACIKRYLCPDEACHERPVGDLLREDGAKLRRMVADIRELGHLEQTLFISFSWENMVDLRAMLPEQKLWKYHLILMSNSDLI